MLRVSLPAGDVELLIGVRDHATVTDVRAAGATCLIEASTDLNGTAIVSSPPPGKQATGLTASCTRWGFSGPTDG